MEEAKETAAEAEAQCGAALGFEAEASIIEAKLADAFAQLFKVGSVGGEQAAEDDRLHFLETGASNIRKRRAVGHPHATRDCVTRCSRHPARKHICRIFNPTDRV